ncbi:hypothetical protein D3C72_2560300 [compost metagenome]
MLETGSLSRVRAICRYRSWGLVKVLSFHLWLILGQNSVRSRSSEPLAASITRLRVRVRLSSPTDRSAREWAMA